ncbi:hypothetical protein AG1IA_07019 [Rhizoctonia solani AG-1 IA]|uniref:Uncharacterized protein n=1 Tax=Thanatephorus cucumeris (strain AG1-IA) TaxID=983506 RepID=L8WQ97_THACA|nr:hypothetical protein AG1IA_07019 [Rhizoctonia solani AG-1 IA]
MCGGRSEPTCPCESAHWSGRRKGNMRLLGELLGSYSLAIWIAATCACCDGRLEAVGPATPSAAASRDPAETHEANVASLPDPNKIQSLT